MSIIKTMSSLFGYVIQNDLNKINQEINDESKRIDSLIEWINEKEIPSDDRINKIEEQNIINIILINENKALKDKILELEKRINEIDIFINRQ